MKPFGFNLRNMSRTAFVCILQRKKYFIKILFSAWMNIEYLHRMISKLSAFCVHGKLPINSFVEYCICKLLASFWLIVTNFVTGTISAQDGFMKNARKSLEWRQCVISVETDSDVIRCRIFGDLNTYWRKKFGMNIFKTNLFPVHTKKNDTRLLALNKICFNYSWDT